jgi:DNA adenine methylase Dam
VSYTNGYLNYTGSKFKLLEQILPEMDYTKEYFVDLFTGSFVVGANVVDKYKKVLANDIISDLVGIHKSLLESDDIIEKTKLLCPLKTDGDAFSILRDSFNNNKTPEKLWALILSCNSNFMRFNKSFNFNQTWGKRSWNDSTQKKVEEFTKHIRPHKDKIMFISKHFSEVKINKPCMVYIDPPYSNTEAGYSAYWSKDDDVKLYDYCKELDRSGSSFMVSGVLTHDGKSCLLLDKLIADGYRYKELTFDYNKVSKKGKKETTEIIIMNY